MISETGLKTQEYLLLSDKQVLSTEEYFKIFNEDPEHTPKPLKSSLNRQSLIDKADSIVATYQRYQ